MSRYELLLTLHVISAAIWLGAGMTITIMLLAYKRASDSEREAALHEDMEFLAPMLFIPASLATLVFGVLAGLEGNWDFGQAWIVIGLAGWLASFTIGIGYFKPESERIAAIVADEGPASSNAARRNTRMTAIDHMELTILYIVLAAMVIKPTGDDTGVLLAMAGVFAAVVALNLPALRATEQAKF